MTIEEILKVAEDIGGPVWIGHFEDIEGTGVYARISLEHSPSSVAGEGRDLREALLDLIDKAVGRLVQIAHKAEVNMSVAGDRRKLMIRKIRSQEEKSGS